MKSSGRDYVRSRPHHVQGAQEIECHDVTTQMPSQPARSLCDLSSSSFIAAVGRNAVDPADGFFGLQKKSPRSCGERIGA